jgi:hypothetical protein
MTTLRDLFHVFAPPSLERYPHLPPSPRKVIHASQHCPSGHDGQSRSQCPSGGAKHRRHHACGNRHGPQGQYHKTRQCFPRHLDNHRPGPHFLITLTVPETRRAFRRSPQRLAYQALCSALAFALKRLAKDERFIGTALPGFSGVLHTWGSQLQYHPHMPYIVPGGGLSKPRTTWRPSRDNFFVPVSALSPLSRAIFKEDMRHAGLLEHIDPQVWNLPWNVHSQAGANGHTAFPSLAP